MSRYFQITGFAVFECNDRLYLNEESAKTAQQQQAVIDGKLYPIERCEAELTTGNPGPPRPGIIPRAAQEAYLSVLMSPGATEDEINAQREKLFNSAQFGLEEEIETASENDEEENQIVVDETGTKLFKSTTPR